jgi:hypothetical protein
LRRLTDDEGQQLLVHLVTVLATVAGIIQAVLVRLRVKEILESYLLLLVRFGASPSSLT